MTTQTRYPEYASPRMTGVSGAWHLIGLDDHSRPVAELGIQWAYECGLYCLVHGTIEARIGRWTKDAAIRHYEAAH